MTRQQLLDELTILSDAYRNLRGRKSATVEHKHTLNNLETYIHRQVTQLMIMESE